MFPYRCEREMIVTGKVQSSSRHTDYNCCDVILF